MFFRTINLEEVCRFCEDQKISNFLKINLKQFYFIEKDKAFLNDTEYENRLIYEVIQELIFCMVVKC